MDVIFAKKSHTYCLFELWQRNAKCIKKKKEKEIHRTCKKKRREENGQMMDIEGGKGEEGEIKCTALNFCISFLFSFTVKKCTFLLFIC